MHVSDDAQKLGLALFSLRAAEQEQLSKDDCSCCITDLANLPWVIWQATPVHQPELCLADLASRAAIQAGSIPADMRDLERNVPQSTAMPSLRSYPIQNQTPPSPFSLFSFQRSNRAAPRQKTHALSTQELQHTSLPGRPPERVHKHLVLASSVYSALQASPLQQLCHRKSLSAGWVLSIWASPWMHSSALWMRQC